MLGEVAEQHSIADYRRGYEEEKRLRGFRSGCGFVTATWGLVCPICRKRDLAEVELSGHGRVAAWAVQNVPGEGFLNDAPYAYVVVELPEGGRITGWMPEVRDPARIRVGEPVKFRPTYRAGVVFEREAPEGSAAPPA